jgi:hypothetical protein
LIYRKNKIHFERERGKRVTVQNCSLPWIVCLF